MNIFNKTFSQNILTILIRNNILYNIIFTMSQKACFVTKHVFLTTSFSHSVQYLQTMFFQKSKFTKHFFTKQIHKYHDFPVTLGLFSQAFIAIRHSVSFIDYNSFAIYRTKRFRLRFTDDRSIFVSFDSTIICNFNFCRTVLSTF